MDITQQRRLETWAPWLLSAGILVVWQLVCQVFAISEFIFPSPVQIVKSLVEHAGPIVATIFVRRMASVTKSR